VIVTEIEGILRRFAIIWSAVEAFVVLVLMSVAIEIISVTDDTDTTTWATVLVFVGIAYAVVASWLIRHHYGALAQGSTALLFSLASFPSLVGLMLGFAGAAFWAMWAAAIASVLLYGWWAWTTRTATRTT
jgi:hypothetical protein